MATGEIGPSSAGERVFRWALRLLPRRFMASYGDEILVFHRSRLQETRGNVLARTAHWLRALRDLLGGVLLEWGREFRKAGGRGGMVDGAESGSAGGSPGRRDPVIRPRSRSPALWIDFLLQDLRFALRSLGRTPGFTVVAAGSLALGVGIIAATFSLFQAIWLKPVPGVRDADAVVELLVIRNGAEIDTWAWEDFEDLRETETPLLSVVGWKEREGTLSTGHGGEAVRMMYVSAGYFRVLGVVPMPGRDFAPEEDSAPGQHPVAVVSHAMWQERLAGDPDVLGQTLTLNQVPYTVIGVAPPEFEGHRVLERGTEVWVPLSQDPWVAGPDPLTGDRGMTWLRVLGRLKPEATLPEANAALGVVFDRIATAHPTTNEGRSARAFPFGPVPAAGRAESLLATGLLFGLLGVVLLIICGNVAGMVLARSVAREQELAVRMALGSGRTRVARLLLAEALVLAVLGGGIGLLLGVWGMGLASAFIPGTPVLSYGLQGPVLVVGIGLTLFTALAVGLLPAVRFSRPGLISSLKVERGSGGRRAGRIHRIAASSLTGVALTLLVSCGLFVRALGVMAQRDHGFVPHGLLTTRIDLSQLGIATAADAAPFLDEVRERLGAIPGVTSVSIGDGIPLDLSGNFTSVSAADAPEDDRARIQVEFTRAGHGFFETAGIPLVRGRGFEVGDVPGSEPVIVITETLARRLWPGEDALGRRLRVTLTRDAPREFTVVGVVPDVASSRATENWPNIFVSLRQNHSPRLMVVVRSAGDPVTVSRGIREGLLEVEPGLPFPTIVPSTTLVQRSTQGQKLMAAVAGGLGFLALLLSAIGVYGVVAFSVSCRTREIGLRMAMGATRETVLRGVFADAVRLAVPGLVVGGLLAGAAAAALRSELLGLAPGDPVSFLGAAGVLLAVIVLASLVPARRAAAVQPMDALRRE